MSLDLYPLTFNPILKERVWGGRRLARLGKPVPAGARIGESWELTDLPEGIADDGESMIANGPWHGRTLDSVIRDQPDAILGRTRRTAAGRFPLLFKYLDANEHLSVQVHPSVEYAKAHADAHVKSEAWVVVQAADDAAIYAGLSPGTEREVFARAVREGRVESFLRRIPVSAGECHYLPSGTCHALGAGVVVAEVQTASDTTFRLYDWERTGRTLHIDQALACMSFPAEEVKTMAPDPTINTRGFRTLTLCRCEHFTIERIDADASLPLDVVTSGKAIVWMVLSGHGAVESTHHEETVPFASGTTMLMPARLQDWSARFDQPTSLLRVETPSDDDSLLAGVL